jgi:hypothetical protein
MSDPNYQSVSLLLNCNSFEGSGLFRDSSPRAKVLESFGGAVQTSAQSRFGGTSAYFDGVDDYLATPANAEFDTPANTAFTIEGWMYLPGAQANFATVFSNGYTTWQSRCRALMLGSNMRLRLVANNTGALLVLAESTVDFPVNEWVHFAYTATAGSPSSFRMFQNGVQVGFSSNNLVHDFGQVQTILGSNGWDGANGRLNAYLDDFRFTKGVARYTADFTPPAAEFLDEVRANMGPELLAGTGQNAVMPLFIDTPLRGIPVVFTYNPDDGTANITGTVAERGVPVNQPLSRRVNLIEQISGRTLAEVWSDPLTGAYTFSGILGGRKYTVVSYDHTGYHRAVIADNLEPT